MRSDWRTHESNPRNFLISFLAVTPRVLIGVASIPLARGFIRPGPWSLGGDVSWTSQFSRWDALLYIDIARKGYSNFQLHAFYPVYPLLIKLVSPFFGYTAGSLIVTWLAAVFAVWGVIDVTRRFTSIHIAWWAGLMLVWNPLSIFFISGYPESLLVAAMIWSLDFCLQSRWWLAAFFAAVASGIIPQGIASGVIVFVAVLLADRTLRGFLRATVFALLGELGIIGYWIYCWQSTGDALIGVHAAQRGWGTHLSYPFHAVFNEWSLIFARQGLGGIRSALALDVVIAVLGVVLSVLALRRSVHQATLLLPALLLIVGLLISVSAYDAGYIATARYILFLAPWYLIIAVLVDRVPDDFRLHVALDLFLVSAFLALTFGLMVNFGWIG